MKSKKINSSILTLIILFSGFASALAQEGQQPQKPPYQQPPSQAQPVDDTYKKEMLKKYNEMSEAVAIIKTEREEKKMNDPELLTALNKFDGSANAFLIKLNGMDEELKTHANQSRADMEADISALLDQLKVAYDALIIEWQRALKPGDDMQGAGGK